MVSTFTYKPSLVRIDHRCTQFRVIVVTDPQTHTNTLRKHTETGPITIHCAAASAECNQCLLYPVVTHCAPSKNHQHSWTTFWVILRTDRQTKWNVTVADFGAGDYSTDLNLDKLVRIQLMLHRNISRSLYFRSDARSAI